MRGNIFSSFIRSAVNQVGRDGGKVISNSLYGDRHSTPIRRVGGYDKSGSPAVGRAGKAVVRQNVEVSNWRLFWYLVLGFLFVGFGSVFLIYNGLKRLTRTKITLKRMVSKDVYIPDEKSTSGKRFAGQQEYIEKENVPSTEYELRTDRRIGLIYYVAGIAFLVIYAIMCVHSESSSLASQVPYIDVVLCVGGILIILLTLCIIKGMNSHNVEEMMLKDGNGESQVGVNVPPIEEEVKSNQDDSQEAQARNLKIAKMQKDLQELSQEANLALIKILISNIKKKIYTYNSEAGVEKISIDPLLEEAAILVYQTNQCEGSQIQRKFSIGYNHSSRIVDQLEILGFVGPFNGYSRPREVLIGKKDYKPIDIDTAFEGIRDYYLNIKKEEDAALRRKELDEEKERIKQEIKENKRRKELREQAMQELQDEGVIEKVHKREPIPQEVQDAVWRRDGGRCVKCGSQENLEFDHIIPFSKGGSNTVRNLQLLCQKCNREKSNHIG